MATNAQNSYPIVAATVPADMLCIRNGQDVVNLVQQFCSVQGLAGNSGSSFPAQDTLGQQALQLAQQNSAQIGALLSKIIVFRASTNYAPVPSGTHSVAISWTDPLPNTNYIVLLGFLAPDSNTGISASFASWTVNGSQTTTGCNIHFDTAPAASVGLQYAWFVIAPPNATSGTPLISGTNPTSGSVGDTVTIFGSGFTSTLNVEFNGTIATFNVASDTVMTAVVPAGATTGSISVTTGNGTVTSPSSFTVV